MMEPREFKWAWDAKKKRTHHWPSTEHARRTHRDDFAKLIGREVSVRGGDVMGHGTYLPEERTHQGDLVGPPTVLLNATFGAEIPEGVFHHFESVYPVTEVRRGHKHEHPPTHHEAKVDWSSPETGADWARENFKGCRVKRSDGRDHSTALLTSSHGLNDGTRQGAAAPMFWREANADMEGAMVALFIPEETGKKIQVDGGESLENLHITLVYFEDKADDREDWEKALEVIEGVLKDHKPLEGKIGGYGVFKNDKNVLWAAPDVPGLAELRHELLEALELEGFDSNDQHGWTPHITLKYDWEGDFPEMDKPIDITFDKVTFARGEKKEHKKLSKVVKVAKFSDDPVLFARADAALTKTNDPQQNAGFSPDSRDIVRSVAEALGIDVEDDIDELADRLWDWQCDTPNPFVEGLAGMIQDGLQPGTSVPMDELQSSDQQGYDQMETKFIMDLIEAKVDQRRGS